MFYTPMIIVGEFWIFWNLQTDCSVSPCRWSRWNQHQTAATLLKARRRKLSHRMSRPKIAGIDVKTWPHRGQVDGFDLGLEVESCGISPVYHWRNVLCPHRRDRKILRPFKAHIHPCVLVPKAATRQLWNRNVSLGWLGATHVWCRKEIW